MAVGERSQSVVEPEAAEQAPLAAALDAFAKTVPGPEQQRRAGALTIALRRVRPGPDAQALAELLTRHLEARTFGEVRDDRGTSCREAAVEALLRLGYPWALTISPEELAWYRGRTGSRPRRWFVLAAVVALAALAGLAGFLTLSRSTVTPAVEPAPPTETRHTPTRIDTPPVPAPAQDPASILNATEVSRLQLLAIPTQVDTLVRTGGPVPLRTRLRVRSAVSVRGEYLRVAAELIDDQGLRQPLPEQTVALFSADGTRLVANVENETTWYPSQAKDTAGGVVTVVSAKRSFGAGSDLIRSEFLSARPEEVVVGGATLAPTSPPVLRVGRTGWTFAVDLSVTGARNPRLASPVVTLFAESATGPVEVASIPVSAQVSKQGQLVLRSREASTPLFPFGLDSAVLTGRGEDQEPPWTLYLGAPTLERRTIEPTVAQRASTARGTVVAGEPVLTADRAELPLRILPTKAEVSPRMAVRALQVYDDSMLVVLGAKPSLRVTGPGEYVVELPLPDGAAAAAAGRQWGLHAELLVDGRPVEVRTLPGSLHW